MDNAIVVVVVGLIVVVVVVVVVVTYHGVVGRLDIGDAERGQLGAVVVQAVLVQRQRRLGRHGGRRSIKGQRKDLSMRMTCG
jgi:hypothetical protein